MGKHTNTLNVFVSILTIIILIAIILSFNIFGLGSLASKGLDSINSISGNLKDTANTIQCPDYVIPSRISLVEEPIRREITRSWKDGTPIGFDDSGDSWATVGKTLFESSCRNGALEGENKNYFYCNNLLYSKETQQTDSNGLIIKNSNLNYRINIVIKPEGNWSILKEPSMERNMLTDDEQEFIDENPANVPKIFNEVMNRNGIYLLDASYIYSQEKRWIKINGEVWVSKSNKVDSIFRNYSVIQSTCVKI